MLVFGVDIPLIEVIVALMVVIFIVLVESIVIVALLLKQLNKTKKLAELVERLSQAILAIKKNEEIELLKKKK